MEDGGLVVGIRALVVVVVVVLRLDDVILFFLEREEVVVVGCFLTFKLTTLEVEGGAMFFFEVIDCIRLDIASDKDVLGVDCRFLSFADSLLFSFSLSILARGAEILILLFVVVVADMVACFGARVSPSGLFFGADEVMTLEVIFLYLLFSFSCLRFCSSSNAFYMYIYIDVLGTTFIPMYFKLCTFLAADFLTALASRSSLSRLIFSISDSFSFRKSPVLVPAIESS